MSRKSKLQMEIEEKIKKYHTLKAEAAKIDAELKSMKVDIVKFLQEKGLLELIVGELTAQATERIVNSFDSTKFSNDYPKLYQDYLVAKPQQRFEVKSLKKIKKG